MPTLVRSRYEVQNLLAQIVLWQPTDPAITLDLHPARAIGGQRRLDHGSGGVAVHTAPDPMLLAPSRVWTMPRPSSVTVDPSANRASVTACSVGC